MEKKALKLWVVLLFLSYVVYAAAVPATRIPMTKSVEALLLEDHTKEERNQKEVFETKEEAEEGRMILDIADYPPTGPNHSHTPKSPGKP
ncbi:unnamed protein product [Sphenostylis stenocarpa]|uniref:Uncharacterized protein n=1 Tax=Sphenostylis stenocarpa TaxID=92480 RepID=A0AA86S996_9FABA|nr:unnamed protein product [Sphenostylis stenocarpa]